MEQEKNTENSRHESLDIEREFDKINRQRSKTRRKIDDLLEQKRLDELINFDDWD